MNIASLVEPDRVHKTVYTDQQIFDAEMRKIWERTWDTWPQYTQVRSQIFRISASKICWSV